MAKNDNMVQTVVRPGQQPTDEQIKEIEAAMAKPIVPDEDAPELTLEQYAEMAAIAQSRRSRQVKPVVALRISISTLEKAKATGKGYTGFLSRLLDNAIDDPQELAEKMHDIADQIRDALEEAKENWVDPNDGLYKSLENLANRLDGQDRKSTV
jgi:uncharacterized protein (DUF4415 family)